MAEQFPTTERHHPFNNDTFSASAKAFQRVHARSFQHMFRSGLLALRYFNV